MANIQTSEVPTIEDTSATENEQNRSSVSRDKSFHNLIEKCESQAASSTERSAQFDHLCDVVSERLVGLDNNLEELLHWNAVIEDGLPPNAACRMVAVTSSVETSKYDCNFAIIELIRLVRLYSQRWSVKEGAVSKVLQEYSLLKRENAVLLREASIAASLVRRLRCSELISIWERLFIQAQRKQRHGRRWEFLIGDFKEQCRAGQNRKGFGTVGGRDVQDNESDDENDTPTAPRLPVKKRGLKNLTSKMSTTDAQISQLEEETDRLKLEIATLRAHLDRNPSANQHVQTDESGSLIEQNARKVCNPEVLCLNVLKVQGWAGVVPGDLYCSVEVQDKQSVAMVVDARETATTTTPATPDDACCVSMFDDEELVLVSTTLEDYLDVLLRSAFNGDVMAHTRLPVRLIAQHCSEAKQSQTTLSDGTVVVASTTTRFHVSLQSTSTYRTYRSSAVPDAQPQNVDLKIFFEAKLTTHAALEKRSDPENQENNLVGRASRRSNRINDVLSGKTNTQSKESENSLGVTGFLFDPREIEIEQAKFSMEEVMALAMLHAQQIQQLQNNFEQQSEDARNTRPPPLATISTEAQTDTVAPRVVEKEIEVIKVVDRVKTVVETIEVPVEKIIEVEKRIEIKVPYEVRVEVKVPVKIRVPAQATSSQNPFVFAAADERDIAKLRNFSVRDPFYLADMPDNFFDRLNFFTARKIHNLDSLSEKTKAVSSDVLEKQIDSKFHLVHSDTHDIRHEELNLPATYMSSPGSNFSPRVPGTFHARGLAHLRNTQPPAIVSLPPLSLLIDAPTTNVDKASALKTLNLYEQASTPHTTHDAS